MSVSDVEVLVTGGTGFIGRWLLAELTRTKVVAAPVRRARQRAAALAAFVDAHGGDSRRLLVVEGDVEEASLGLADRFEQVRDVYHLAARFAFGQRAHLPAAGDRRLPGALPGERARAPRDRGTGPLRPRASDSAAARAGPRHRRPPEAPPPERWVLPLGLVRLLPEALTGVPRESLSFLAEDAHDTRAADAHVRAIGLAMPPIQTSVERWCDHLVATRFGAAPAAARRRAPASSVA
ncbi:SDR family oxidoreductase [Sorangium sp. So ce176]|uniref:SDR family oxidoreductase n=1 Tax=Sorangium sp. So ce176 TaxID=3133286 RepID=UPI003F5FA62E